MWHDEYMEIRLLVPRYRRRGSDECTCLVLNQICPASSDLSSKSIGFVRLKEPDFGLVRYRCRICPVEQNWTPNLSGPPRKFSKCKSFFPTLIFELRGTKMDETWTQGPHERKEYILKAGFSKIQIFPFRFYSNSKI
jgi:hypothetical protein